MRAHGAVISNDQFITEAGRAQNVFVGTITSDLQAFKQPHNCSRREARAGWKMPRYVRAKCDAHDTPDGKPRQMPPPAYKPVPTRSQHG